MLTAALLGAKLLYTGIVVLVPSAKDPHLVRVVVPNGTVPRIQGVPSHTAYIMFDMRNLSSDGRQPDLVFSVPATPLKFGVCLINQEYLDVSGTFSKSDLCQPTRSSFQVADCDGAQAVTTDAFPKVPNEDLSADNDSLRWLLDLGRANPGIESKISNDVLKKLPQSGRVALRMNLTDGKMTIAPRSFDFRFAYRLKADGECQALAKTVMVTMEDNHKPSTLIFESTSFDGKTKHPKLRLKSSTGDLAVLIGNEPPADIEMSINLLRGTPISSHHEDTSHHIQLVKNLLKDINTKLVPPAEIPAGVCQNGRSFKVSELLQSGDGGTCNPGGMPAMDPNGN